MENNIEKVCIIESNSITLNLCDLRDNYIDEDALGEIGNIYISREGVFIFPLIDTDIEIYKKRNDTLLSAFTELFGNQKHDFLSSKYYHQIQNMIKNNQLSIHGYEIENLTIDKTVPLKKQYIKEH